jgi:hypothetical protein
VPPGAGAFVGYQVLSNTTAWHALRLSAKGTAIAAAVDGAQVWAGDDATFANGQVAIGSGYHQAAFDDFAVDKA